MFFVVVLANLIYGAILVFTIQTSWAYSMVPVFALPEITWIQSLAFSVGAQFIFGGDVRFISADNIAKALK